MAPCTLPRLSSLLIVLKPCDATDEFKGCAVLLGELKLVTRDGTIADLEIEGLRD